MTKSQKAKAKLELFITYEGDEATTNNISYVLKRAVEYLEDNGLMSNCFDMEVVEYTWGVECDIVEGDK